MIFSQLFVAVKTGLLIFIQRCGISRAFHFFFRGVRLKIIPDRSGAGENSEYPEN
jgi:hypothetical protein